MKDRVLFVCVHNSARSQMAEELLRKYGGERFEAESAGIEPGRLNPVVVELLREEEGIDISGKETKGVADLLKKGVRYDHVITVCDESQSEKCPFFPGGGKREHWSFEDPSSFTGSPEEVRERTRQVMDRIKEAVKSLIRKERPHGIRND